MNRIQFQFRNEIRAQLIQINHQKTRRICFQQSHRSHAVRKLFANRIIH